MTYIDCYLIPIPIENKVAYEELARISAQVLLENGALRSVECWLDHSGPEASSYHASDVRLDSDQYSTFIQAAGARAGETVVMSFVEWPDKAAPYLAPPDVELRLGVAGTGRHFEASALTEAGRKCLTRLNFELSRPPL